MVRMANSTDSSPHYEQQVDASAKETLEILSEMSKIMNTGLDLESLSITYRLIENGINPQTLSDVISNLRKEVQKPNAYRNQSHERNGHEF